MSFWKWFFMVIFGLIPMIMRFMLGYFVPGIRWLAEADIVAFGLVLTITNMNGIETSNAIGQKWKSHCLDLSVIFIALLSALFAVTCFCELPAHPISEIKVRDGAILLSLVSLCLSFLIWNPLVAGHNLPKEF